MKNIHQMVRNIETRTIMLIWMYHSASSSDNGHAEKHESRCALYQPDFYTKPLCGAGSVVKLESARLQQWHYILNRNSVPHCSKQPAPKKVNVSRINSCDQNLTAVNKAEPSYDDVVKRCNGKRTCWGLTAQEVTVDEPPDGCKPHYQNLRIDYNCEPVNVTKLQMGKTQEEEMCEPDLRVELKGAMFGSRSCNKNGLCGAKMCLVSIEEVDNEYYNSIKKTCGKTNNCHGLVTKNYTCGEGDNKGCHNCNWDAADYIVLDWVCKNSSEVHSGTLIIGMVVGTIAFIIVILAVITVAKFRKRMDEIVFSTKQRDRSEKATVRIKKLSISAPIPIIEPASTEPLQSQTAPQKPSRTVEENNISLQRMTQQPPKVPINNVHQSPSTSATDDQEEYSYTTVKPPLSQKPNRDQ